ncbi:TonB-dependent receptor [Methylomonas sp. OY6]|uniref:TonB-dependent receptor n=1 Tax=Methylomonas defluvii TaxID=3045149 RepID=A0ABU4UJS5_9GAMM|nr:TonB-dependent receptor [Methylomonas sp. OY6]MDX8129401.1 TonB-dependent receptor [Methylomonas sp. OY6]
MTRPYSSLYWPSCALLPIGIVLAAPAGAETLAPGKAEVELREAELEDDKEQVLAETKVKSTAVPQNPRLADPVPKTGVSRDEFANRNNRRTGEIVKRMSGSVVDDPGESKDIKLRGLDKEYTRVQVDGVQLPNGGEKREFQVNQLPSFMVGQVNVLRNSSAEYENDGIAGRVEIKTREIPTEPKLEARFGYGGRNNMDGDLLHGQFGFGYKPVDWFGGMGAFDHLDNLIDRTRDKRFSTRKRELEHETERSHSDNVFSDLALFYDGGEFHAKPMLLNLDKLKVKTKLTTEPAKAGSGETETEDAVVSTSGATFTHRHNFSGGPVWESLFAYHSSTEDKDKNKVATKESAVGSGRFNLDKTTLERENKEDETWTLNSALRVPFTLGLRQELKFGGAVRERVRFRDKNAREISKTGVVRSTTTAKDNYYMTENYYAGFVQDNVWLNEAFSVMPGVRAEHVDLQSRTGDGSQADKTVTDLNPSFHALYRVRDDLSLRFAFSKSVNRPKFDELSPFAVDNGTTIVIGSPQLDPARALNYDLGGEYASGNLFLALNLFHKAITDIIEEVDTGVDQGGKDVYQVQNVGDGWTHGIELEQRLSLAGLGIPALQGAQLWANQTLLDSKVRDFAGNNRRFKQQPSFTANVGIDFSYAPTGTIVTAALNYLADRPEYKANGDVTMIESSLTLDLSARQQLYKGLSLFGEVDNVTNRERVDVENLANGTNTRKVENYGRTFMAGLTLQF